jgi:hypothetical protein
MGLTKVAVRSGSGEVWEMPPEDNHPARLVAIIDLGTHSEPVFGKPAEEHDVHKVFFAWELVGDDKKSNGSPFVVGRDFTLYLTDRSHLRKWVELMGFKVGESFDFRSILGCPCLLQLKHEPSKKDPTKKYLNLESVSKPVQMKGYTFPAATLPNIFFDLDAEEANPTDPAQVPTWLPFHFGSALPEVIMRSHEWKERKKSGNGPSQDPDAPF